VLSRAWALGLRPRSRVMASTLGLLPAWRTKIVKGSPAMRGALTALGTGQTPTSGTSFRAVGLAACCRGRNSIRKTCDRAGTK
jgi:hypothetical protein